MRANPFDIIIPIICDRHELRQDGGGGVRVCAWYAVDEVSAWVRLRCAYRSKLSHPMGVPLVHIFTPSARTASRSPKPPAICASADATLHCKQQQQSAATIQTDINLLHYRTPVAILHPHAKRERRQVNISYVLYIRFVSKASDATT